MIHKSGGRRLFQIPTSHAGLPRLRLFDMTAGALAPLLAISIRDPSYFARDGLEGILTYSAIAAISTLAILLYFRLGQILSRYLSMGDLQRILKASLAATLLIAAAAFTLMRLDLIPRSMPLMHFLVLAVLLGGSRGMYKKQWDEGQYRPLLQVGVTKHKDAGDVPLFRDLVGNEADRMLVDLATAPLGLGYPYMMGPAVPAKYVNAMRDGFMSVFADEDFLRDAGIAHLEVDPISGVDVQAAINAAYAAPADVRRRIRAIFEGERK